MHESFLPLFRYKMMQNLYHLKYTLHRNAMSSQTDFEIFRISDSEEEMLHFIRSNNIDINSLRAFLHKTYVDESSKPYIVLTEDITDNEEEYSSDNVQNNSNIISNMNCASNIWEISGDDYIGQTTNNQIIPGRGKQDAKRKRRRMHVLNHYRYVSPRDLKLKYDPFLPFQLRRSLYLIPDNAARTQVNMLPMNPTNGTQSSAPGRFSNYNNNNESSVTSSTHLNVLNQDTEYLPHQNIYKNKLNNLRDVGRSLSLNRMATQSLQYGITNNLTNKIQQQPEFQAYGSTQDTNQAYRNSLLPTMNVMQHQVTKHLVDSQRQQNFQPLCNNYQGVPTMQSLQGSAPDNYIVAGNMQRRSFDNSQQITTHQLISQNHGLRPFTTTGQSNTTIQLPNSFTNQGQPYPSTYYNPATSYPYGLSDRLEEANSSISQNNLFQPSQNYGMNLNNLPVNKETKKIAKKVRSVRILFDILS
jgi:hypothetical protein